MSEILEGILILICCVFIAFLICASDDERGWKK